MSHENDEILMTKLEGMTKSPNRIIGLFLIRLHAWFVIRHSPFVLRHSGFLRHFWSLLAEPQISGCEVWFVMVSIVSQNGA